MNQSLCAVQEDEEGPGAHVPGPEAAGAVWVDQGLPGRPRQDPLLPLHEGPPQGGELPFYCIKQFQL